MLQPRQDSAGCAGGLREIAVTIQGFQHIGPNCSQRDMDRRIIDLPSGLSVGQWNIVDAMNVATPSVSFEVLPCDGCYCDPLQPMDCQIDCQCLEDWLCIAGREYSGEAHWSCGTTCSNEHDCRADRTCDSSYNACAPLDEPECSADSECPPGYACRDDFCQPVMEITGPPCLCSADCRTGQTCIAHGSDGTTRSCLVPCQSDYDCPSVRESVCGELTGGPSSVCVAAQI